MKRRLTTTIVALLLCVCTVFGFAGCSHAKKDEVNGQIATVNEQITAINKSIDDLKATDTALDGYIKALQASVAELETELDATNTKLAELEQNKNDSTYVTVTQLEEAKTALQGQIDATNTAIEALKSSDKTQNDKISALESAKTTIEGQITAIDNRLKIVENAAALGGSCLCDNSLYATKTELAEAKTALEGQLATINSTLADLETADTNLSNALSALETELKKADSDNKAALEASLAELKTALEKADSTNKSDIESKIAALKTELSKADTDNKTELEGKVTALESKLSASITANANAISALEISVKSINTEITNVKNTINTVKAELEKAVADLKAELDTEKSNTAKEIAALKVSIESLESKDTELGNKITSLEETVKTLASMDWTNATFATLEQYEGVQASISSINAEITSLKDSVASKTELTNAISASEASMKTWVSGEFTEFAKGYYTISQIDAMIAQLRSEAYDDSGIKQDLADQKKALENAKADIKTAYEKAISDAITDNNGVIDTKISKAIEEANATLTSDISVIKNRLATIENDIAALKSDLAAVTGRVNTIEEQIEAIKTSIASLENVDTELKGYIEALQNKVKTLEENSGTKAEIKALQDLITSLQEKDSALEEKITSLKEYVDDELASNKDWANATFATLEKLASTNNEIASIKTTIEGLASSEDLNSAISESKDSLKKWVNEEFAKGYYTIAEIDAKLKALSSSAYDETQIKADIEAQKTALENAKTELTNAYKQAIDEAIEKNKGEINTKIANDIKAAKEELQATITAIETRVTALEGKVEQHDKDIQDLLDKITTLQNQINCMNGIHVDGDVSYAWSENFTKCAAVIDCKHCGKELSCTEATVNYADGTVTATFEDTQYETQIKNLTDATNMTADELKMAVACLLNNNVTDLKLTLAANANAEMFTAIGSALNASSVGNGSVDLTLNGALTIYKVSESKKLKSVTLTDATRIEEEAFFNCSNLTSVTALKVQAVVNYAFKNSGITAIDLPAATAINGQVFENCTALTSVDLPRATYVGASAFKGCTALKSISLTEIAKLSDLVFRDCSSLEYINVPKVTQIGTKAFNGTGTSVGDITLILSAEGDILVDENSGLKEISEKVHLTLRYSKKETVEGCNWNVISGHFTVNTDTTYITTMKFKSIEFTCTDGTFNHTLDNTRVVYKWGADDSFCSACYVCTVCQEEVVQERENSKLTEDTLTVTFTNEAFKAQAKKVFTYDEATNTYTVTTETGLHKAFELAATTGKANNPATVKLMADIELKSHSLEISAEYAILDLNGYTLSGKEGLKTSNNQFECLIYISIPTDVVTPVCTIKDSSENGGGKLSATDLQYVIANLGVALNLNSVTVESEGSVLNGIFSTGNVNINGGKISVKNTKENGKAYGINLSGAECTINGCTIIAEGATAKVLSGSGFTIKGGTFSSDPTEFVETNAYDIIDNGDGTWTVKAKATE